MAGGNNSGDPRWSGRARYGCRRPAAPGDDDAPLIVGAVDVAMSTVAAAIMALPADEDPQFAHRIRAVLADVRQLEAITAARCAAATVPRRWSARWARCAGSMTS